MPDMDPEIRDRTPTPANGAPSARPTPPLSVVFPSRLLNIASEIRQLILLAALVPDGRRVGVPTYTKKGCFRSPRSSQLLRVCHLLYNEGVDILYGEPLFAFSHAVGSRYEPPYPSTFAYEENAHRVKKLELRGGMNRRVLEAHTGLTHFRIALLVPEVAFEEHQVSITSVEDKGKLLDMMLSRQWFASAVAQLSQMRNSSQWLRLNNIEVQIHYMSFENIHKELDYQGHARVVGETGFPRLLLEVGRTPTSLCFIF